MDIGDNLKLYRTGHNLSQSDLADKLHVSRKTISGWENNRSSPDIDTLNTLSRLYGVKIDELLISDPSLLSKKIKSEVRRKKILKFSYISNIPLCILGYFELTGFNGVHSFFITLFLSINLLVFLINSTVDDLKLFRSLPATIFFILIFLFNLQIGVFNNATERYLTDNTSYNAGIILSCLIHALLCAFSMIIIIFHMPHKLNIIPFNRKTKS